jgi:phosphatidylserine/phosphatidylglycerophosphate/cardiolipin synthase-like enzyme
MSDQNLYESLLMYFKGVTPQRGQHVAKILTDSINKAISQHKTCLLLPIDIQEELVFVLSNLDIQPASLCLPWQAYNSSQSLQEFQWHKGSAIKAILATVPDAYSLDISSSLEFSAPFEGSLLAYISELISSAQNHLWVINPYWSVNGVKRLQRRFGVSHQFPLKATLITPSNLEGSHLEGFCYFKKWLQDNNVVVQHYIPYPLDDGSMPLVHAKVMIADNVCAYIGSANLSENGMSRSIEMGVGVEGPIVIHIVKWFDSMRKYFELLT